MARQLSENQKRFCEEYLKSGYDGEKAYKIAYPDFKHRPTAEVVRLLKNQQIRDYIEILEGSFSLVGKKLWVDKAFMVKWLLEWMIATRKIFDRNGNFKEDVPDWNTRMRAFKQFSEIAGYTKEPQKGEEDLDYNNEDKVSVADLSKEEVEKYKAKLLKEL